MIFEAISCANFRSRFSALIALTEQSLWQSVIGHSHFRLGKQREEVLNRPESIRTYIHTNKYVYLLCGTDLIFSRTQR